VIQERIRPAHEERALNGGKKGKEFSPRKERKERDAAVGRRIDPGVASKKVLRSALSEEKKELSQGRKRNARTVTSGSKSSPKLGGTYSEQEEERRAID